MRAGMKKFLCLLFSVMLGFFFIGCASSKIKGYIGQPVSIVIGDYGLPAGAYDIDKNRRAFVWQRDVMAAGPGSFVATASDIDNRMFSQTYSRSGSFPSSSCNYVLVAQRTRTDIYGPDAWTVMEFQKPRVNCE
jgi:hypothetical protein